MPEGGIQTSGYEEDMTKAFSEVQAEDFSRITVERLPHQEIEMALIALGGGGVKGIQYKTDVVKAAGWNRERLSTYAGNPELAAETFNRIRTALAETDDPDQVVTLVAAG